MNPARPKPCGTDAGYGRHLQAGETRCDPCLAAHAQTIRKWAQQQARERRAWRAEKAARDAAHNQEAAS